MVRMEHTLTKGGLQMGRTGMLPALVGLLLIAGTSMAAGFDLILVDK